MYINCKVLIYCFLLIKVVESIKILCIFIFPSHSHQIVYNAVCKELALRGHQVTMITTNPIRNPMLSNLTEIDISFANDMWKNRNNVINKDKSLSIKEIYILDLDILANIVEQVLLTTEVNHLIHDDTIHFDLLIVEWLHPTIFAFSAKYNCPFIGISSFEMDDVFRYNLGNPIHPGVYPNKFLPFTDELSILDRMKSFQFSVSIMIFFETELYPNSDKMIRKYFGNNMPPIKKIMKNVSLVLENLNPFISKATPNFPNIITFSGIHIESPAPLPQNVQKFIDDAKDGVIYFSLGSNIKSTYLSKELKQIFLESFNELPYKVLWKYEEEIIHDTDKIFISKWLPQSDILAHPNVKVFITQGGLQSFEEAIRRKVPMVGIPFFIDQPKNMHRMVKLGLGQIVDKSTLTKETLKRTIIDVAENQTYHRNIEKLAALLEDEPMKPLDKVIWWIQYVIRHKGAYHLRSPYIDVSWYQLFFLDIIALVLLCSILVACAIIFALIKLTKLAKIKKD